MNTPDLRDLSGAKCRVFGLGMSNEALISYLFRNGAEICVSDKRKSEKEITDVLQKNGITKAAVLPYYLAQKVDFVFRTPSVRPDAKEIVDNTSLGATLTSEVALFFAKAKGKIFGITGSDGKTTTTSIAYELLKRVSPDSTFVGGNIGIPLVSLLDKQNDSSVTVCELSSFQLMDLNNSPHSAVITNLTENHLDYHKDMLEYATSKSRIYSGNECKKLVIGEKYKNYFNKISKLPDNVISVGSNIAVEKGKITYFGSELLDASDIKMVGYHNIINLMSAIGLSYPICSFDDIRCVANEFGGVEHRLEFVLEQNGVKFYNSSIDSTPSRTMVTLSCFDKRNVVLILGGYDKNLDFSELSVKSQRIVKKYVLHGANKWKIYNSLITNGVAFDKVTVCSNFAECIYTAYSFCSRGDVLLLSPASASFDCFLNFEQRGKEFKNIVKNI